MEHRRIRTNGIELHAVGSGDPKHPLVLLLHGFPEFWYGWRSYLEPLSQAGLYALAPDQRGFNTSDKPPRVADYHLDILAEDVLGLIEAHGREDAFLVGHDWGAAVAWWVAMKHPKRVKKLAVLNVPHPVAMRHFMFRHVSQLRRSWYMFFFQLPLMPELAFQKDDGAKVFDGMARQARPGTFTADDEAAYREAWRQPAAVTSMLNWYRSAFRSLLLPDALPTGARIEPETLILWGKRDINLDARMAEESAKFCRSVRIEWFEDASHWVQHEERDAITQLLTDYLK
jgi:pimeloyl-ACP methyl ester carboxylesterase